MKNLTIAILVCCIGILTTSSITESNTTLPEEGVVPNKEVAIKIAEAILFEAFGEEEIKLQKPYYIKLNDNEVWIINGTVPNNGPGGSFIIEIQKEDAKVLRLGHTL